MNAKPEAAITLLPEHAEPVCSACGATVELVKAFGAIAASDIGPIREWTYTQETGWLCPRHG
jgi:hypothetical protein